MRLRICRLMALLLASLPMMGSVAGRVHAAGIASHGQASPAASATGQLHATVSAKPMPIHQWAWIAIPGQPQAITSILTPPITLTWHSLSSRRQSSMPSR